MQSSTQPQTVLGVLSDSGRSAAIIGAGVFCGLVAAGLIGVFWGVSTPATVTGTTDAMPAAGE
jgi:hypothetical protein